MPSQGLCCVFLEDVCVSVWVCAPLERLMLGVVRAGWNRGVQEGSCPSSRSDDPLSV